MYLLSIVLILFILLILILWFRRRPIIARIRAMTRGEKILFLNQIIAPFGFVYDECSNVFTSTLDAWQREFGYCRFYDRTAPFFNMIFDSEPVYFNYDGRTWLLEFWKGQYGINIGTEIGLYHADRILTPDEYEQEVFSAADNRELIRMYEQVLLDGYPLQQLSARHWWLTTFRMGEYANPAQLSGEISLVFPNAEMRNAFLDSMLEMGYSLCDFAVWNESVSFTYQKPRSRQPKGCGRLYTTWVMWKNHVLIRLFRLFTRPFESMLDRMVFLLISIPFAFRRSIGVNRMRKHRRRQGRGGLRAR